MILFPMRKCLTNSKRTTSNLKISLGPLSLASHCLELEKTFGFLNSWTVCKLVKLAFAFANWVGNHRKGNGMPSLSFLLMCWAPPTSLATIYITSDQSDRVMIRGPVDRKCGAFSTHILAKAVSDSFVDPHRVLFMPLIQGLQERLMSPMLFFTRINPMRLK